MLKRRWGLVFGFIAFTLLLVVPSAAGYYTDWLWYRELGYEHVFLKSLNAQGTVFLATFVAVFAFLLVNLRLAQGALRRPPVVVGHTRDGRPLTIQSSDIVGWARPGAMIVALMFGLSGASNWLAWLSFFNAVPFGDRDPLFGRDVAFYVFRLPIWQSIREQALVVTFLALLSSAMLYLLSGSFVLEARGGGMALPRFRLVPRARKHLALLGALIFALLAWGTWLAMAHTLLTPSGGAVFGASYVDVNANLPFLRVTIGILILGAGLAIWHGFGGRGWAIPLAIGLYLTVSVISGIYAGLIQSFVVGPNESSKEQEYIKNNIAATRRAYALDQVEERELTGDAALTPQQIANNAATIENVRLWDHDQLLQTFSQIQEIRTYYDFISVDNDRYTVDGKERQVMLSVRELNTELLPTPSFVNQRLTFTHGYGLTLGPVNQVTTEGLPVLFVQDLPPRVTGMDLPITEPSIYFGELSSDYALVRTGTPEFHYPQGDDNVTTYYQGKAGVPVGGLLRRLAFALRFGTTDILVTGQIGPESRILFHRRIRDRVATLAPFLLPDNDPYPVVHDGRIFWIQDAYTTSSNYPYSTPLPSNATARPMNYVRNSVKIVIDAYNGTTTFYMAEPTDPIVMTIAKVFPALFRPLEEMPATLRQHVRYPEDIFRWQASIYTTFHMTNPSVFYNKEDQWQVPVLDSDRSGAGAPLQPYYTIMKLPGEAQAEFVQILPFTPRAKDNLAAWMVARSDGKNYGRTIVFQFPKQKIVYGPRQIAGRISQDQIISPQITLWNQQGSEVKWGTLLVIPIEESLIYVRPLYLRSPEGRIPELKRVVVAYQNQIVMAETLKLALVQIFGPAVEAALPADRLAGISTAVIRAPDAVGPGAVAPGAAPPAIVGTPEAASEAQTHYDRAQKALRDGDLALFGEEWRKVGDALQKLRPAPKK
jgi:uncharacterized membrane protein (UPF0182 family)